MSVVKSTHFQKQKLKKLKLLNEISNYCPADVTTNMTRSDKLGLKMWQKKEKSTSVWNDLSGHIGGFEK